MQPWLERFADALFRRSGDINHDLKTPLNIAVLNLELLKMRVAKVGSAEDQEKIRDYAASIETELRRMARIFDVVFLQAVPPADRQAPAAVDLASMLEPHFPGAGRERRPVLMHEERARELVGAVASAAGKIFQDPPAVITDATGGRTVFRFTERPALDPSEIGKLFKFYFSDASGAPDVALAEARLLAEIYGGALDAHIDDGELVLELTLPSGEE